MHAVLMAYTDANQRNKCHAGNIDCVEVSLSSFSVMVMGDPVIKDNPVVTVSCRVPNEPNVDVTYVTPLYLFISHSQYRLIYLLSRLELKI